MKNIKYIAIIAIAAFFSSCDEDYLDINTDPNNPVSVAPSITLPVAQVYTGQYLYYDRPGSRSTNTLGNMMAYTWSQSSGYSWYFDEMQYLVTNSFYDQVWNDAYGTSMRNYQVLLNTEGEQYDNYKAIAKIMLAYHFQMLVDTYGDIPYTEALQRGLNPQPIYDNAEDVYRGLMVDLKDAVDMIDNADSDDEDPGQYDVMFNGNMDMWKKFANTLKLRLVVRTSEVASFSSDNVAAINEIQSNGAGFLTETAFLNPGYANAVNQQNPFWRSFGTNVTGDPQNNYLATIATPYVLEFLIDTNDPRLNYIYEEPATGHKGAPQGWTIYPDDYEAEFVSNLGPGILKSAEQGAAIITAAESYFLQAEAAQRGLIDGNAKSFYQQGIEASFEYLGVTSSPSDYYTIALDNVSWDASDDKIEAIITQKWIALNSINGHEIWIEYNRTGYPSDLPISLLASTPDRPVRLMYPASEISVNGINVPSQPNPFTDKIFWAN